LIGGETAEMPGLYGTEDYDIAGTIVGVVDEKQILDKRKVKKGDVLIGLPSTGLHTNGYSLARRVLLEKFSLDAYLDELGSVLGDTLLAVHRSYKQTVYPLLQRPLARNIHGLSHITGGGIEGNTMRVIPNGLALNINWNGWERPPIFRLIQRIGNVPEEDMRRTFNLGVGLILIVDCKSVENIISALKQKKERPFILGEIVRKV
jgi:phosphoribosylformylglycinamidine cyclo-ligase